MFLKDKSMILHVLLLLLLLLFLNQITTKPFTSHFRAMWHQADGKAICKCQAINDFLFSWCILHHWQELDLVAFQSIEYVKLVAEPIRKINHPDWLLGCTRSKTEFMKVSEPAKSRGYTFQNFHQFQCKFFFTVIQMSGMKQLKTN